MSADIRLEADDLECAACGDPVERGYAPAVSEDGGHRIRAEAAVCDVCGFNDVGFAGCAPELGDFDGGGDVLVSFAYDGTLSDARLVDGD